MVTACASTSSSTAGSSTSRNSRDVALDSGGSVSGSGTGSGSGSGFRLGFGASNPSSSTTSFSSTSARDEFWKRSGSPLFDLPTNSQATVAVVAVAGSGGDIRGPGATVSTSGTSDVHRLSPGRQRRRPNSPDARIGLDVGCGSPSAGVGMSEETTPDEPRPSPLDAPEPRRPSASSQASLPTSSAFASHHPMTEERRNRAVTFDTLPSPIQTSAKMATASFSSSRSTPSPGSPFFPLQPKTSRRRISPSAKTRLSPGMLGDSGEGSTPRWGGNRLLITHRSDDDVLSSMFGPMSSVSTSTSTSVSVSAPSTGTGGSEFFSPPSTSPSVPPNSPSHRIRRSPGSSPSNRQLDDSHGSDNAWMMSDSFSKRQGHYQSGKPRSSGNQYGIPPEQVLSFGQALMERESERQMVLSTTGPPSNRPTFTSSSGGTIPGSASRSTDCNSIPTNVTTSTSSRRTTVFKGLRITAPAEMLLSSSDIVSASSSPGNSRPKPSRPPSWNTSMLSPAPLDGVRSAAWEISKARSTADSIDRGRDSFNAIEAAFGRAAATGPQVVSKATIDALMGDSDPAQHLPLDVVPPGPVSPSTVTTSASSRSSRSTMRFRSYKGPNLPELDHGNSRAELFYLAFGDGGATSREAFNSGKTRKQRRFSASNATREASPEVITYASDSQQVDAPAKIEGSTANTIWSPSPTGNLPKAPPNQPSRSRSTSTTYSDGTTANVSEFDVEELPLVLKADLAAAAKGDGMADVSPTEIEDETTSSSGSSSDARQEQTKSKSSKSSAVWRRRPVSREEIHPAVILPVRELQVTSVDRSQPLTPTATVVSSASSGSNSSHPRIQNAGRLRPHGTFTTARQPSTQLHDKKSRPVAAALVADERFIKISEGQLEAAAFAGDQIAETHLRQRDTDARRGRSTCGSSRLEITDYLPEIGVSSIHDQDLSMGYASLEAERLSPSEESSCVGRRKSSTTSTRSYGSDVSRRKSSGSSLQSYLSAREANAAEASSPGLTTITEGVKDGSQAIQPRFNNRRFSNLAGDKERAGSVAQRESSGATSTTSTTPINYGAPTYLNVTGLSTAIDTLISEPTGSKEADPAKNTVTLQEGPDPFAHLRQGQKRLRITGDPFSTDMSLLPASPMDADRWDPSTLQAGNLQSPAQLTPGSNTLQSELFSDVARLTSLDLRKGLAREAKERRLSREASEPNKMHSSPSRRATVATTFGPSGAIVFGAETREERHARRERRRQEKARLQLDTEWRKELEERDAIAPKVTGPSSLHEQSIIAEEATPSRSEIKAALRADSLERKKGKGKA